MACSGTALYFYVALAAKVLPDLDILLRNFIYKHDCKTSFPEREMVTTKLVISYHTACEESIHCNIAFYDRSQRKVTKCVYQP
jgi:hypothetical protein